MRTGEEIKERINYLEQCIVKDVTEGLINVAQLQYYRTEIATLKYVLQENNKDAEL